MRGCSVAMNIYSEHSTGGSGTQLLALLERDRWTSMTLRSPRILDGELRLSNKSWPSPESTKAKGNHRFQSTSAWSQSLPQVTQCAFSSLASHFTESVHAYLPQAQSNQTRFETNRDLIPRGRWWTQEPWGTFSAFIEDVCWSSF